jgi:hypothetical protein
LASRIESIRETIEGNEEATKTALIMPFFQMLGYDVFNPLEFVPEYTADVGIKKGEKVDYAIVLEDKPTILIECKACGEDLTKHGSQLFRYFGTSEAKFGILTNGVNYQFFTDLEDENKIDLRPFLSIDLLKLRDRDVTEISKFARDLIDVGNIISSAEDLKYTQLIKEWFTKELDAPTDEFVRFVLNQDVYSGVKTQVVIDKLKPVVKKALNQFITDSVNNKIQTALNKDVEMKDAPSNEEPISLKKEREIETTIEELESYAIIKSILRDTVSADRIAYRDTLSYFGILLDDNSRKWICRVHLGGAKQYLEIAGEDKTPIRQDIESLDDIYNYKDALIEAVMRYEK